MDNLWLIGGGLVILVVLLLVLSRGRGGSIFGLLAVILGLVGVGAVLTKRRRDALKRLEEKEKALAEQEKELQTLRDQDAADAERLAELEARINAEREAASREFLAAAEETEERKAEIDAMSAADLIERARRLSGEIRADQEGTG